MTKIAVKFGLIFFAALLVYFLLMGSLNLSDNFDFRVFNGLFQSVIIYLALRTYSRKFPQDWNYLTGVITGVLTSLIGVLPFAIFQILYLNINVDFMSHLKENVPYIGQYLNPFYASLIVLVEGMAVGMVLSYICMRTVDAMMKKSTIQKEG
jgi:hypothetical protein